jgi:hypothetical protein
VSELEGDFDINIRKIDNKFTCNIIIHFDNYSKMDKKEFPLDNKKKLLKYLKTLIKSSVKFHECIKLLEEFKIANWK